MTVRTAIQRRSTQVLRFLEEAGPAAITVIALALMMAAHLVRYSLEWLKARGKAHIAEWKPAIGADGKTRYIALFGAGDGKDVLHPNQILPLDFHTGRDLSPIFLGWSLERASIPAVEGTDEELGL